MSLAVFIVVSPWGVSYVSFPLWFCIIYELSWGREKKFVSPCNPLSAHVMSPSWQQHHRFGILLGRRKAIKMWRKRSKGHIWGEKQWKWDCRYGKESFGRNQEWRRGTACDAPNEWPLDCRMAWNTEIDRWIFRKGNRIAMETDVSVLLLAVW